MSGETRLTCRLEFPDGLLGDRPFDLVSGNRTLFLNSCDSHHDLQLSKGDARFKADLPVSPLWSFKNGEDLIYQIFLWT
jgi:hypothetical protein